ncbi:hypothetical protein [Paeniglutamicibacter cryotolerans]|uniref:Uncharacterized protein n=1 Tax=Paeniglutamicibacter cryotolerans TaxID=670079 RepID=A0A839QWB6_9MICC|nr:hypothetical protein [Paeniglutamicibacter cryotolerans]MBB2996301.1 hypothetical protein [Paeniglutamicibacter cryotolerans]
MRSLGPTWRGIRSRLRRNNPAKTVTPAAEPEAPAQPETASERPEAQAASPVAERPRAEVRAAGSPGTTVTRVIAVVSTRPGNGTSTVSSLLARRYDPVNTIINEAGPGLTRAAFTGALQVADAIVLVTSPDPTETQALNESLQWLRANGRGHLVERCVFVVNLGASDAAPGPLVLPADLDRPVIVLPVDPALGQLGSASRQPRRATRSAINQLGNELSNSIQEK